MTITQDTNEQQRWQQLEKRIRELELQAGLNPDDTVLDILEQRVLELEAKAGVGSSPS